MSRIVDTTRGVANELAVKSRGFIDDVFPTDKRTKLYNQTHALVVSHPRIASFLFFNLVLSGLPLVTFITFSISVFVFTLLSTLVIIILSTVFITVSAVGFALVFSLPTVFFTTVAATFLWVWAFAAFTVWRYYTEDKEYSQPVRQLTRRSEQAADKEKTRQVDDGKKARSPESEWMKVEGHKSTTKSEESPRPRGRKSNGTSNGASPPKSSPNVDIEKVLATNPYELLNEGKDAMDEIPSIETQD